MLDGTYNFKEVNFIFGVRQIKGFEEGSEIVAERSEDTFTAKADVDGNVTRSKSNNTMGTVTFSLSQFSELNKYLTAIMNLDERTGKGGILPLKITDKSNPNVENVIATQAWLTKPSNKSYGGEAGAREWVITCADMNIIQL